VIAVRGAIVASALAITCAATRAQSATPAAASRNVIVYGQRIHYLEAGSGPTVILLHGLADDATIWSATIPALGSKFHVVAVDQIGFGESDKPFLQYRVATLVEFLEGFFKATGIARATLVGNSLGGWTAAAFAVANPAKVDRLVLVDAAGYSNSVILAPKQLDLLNTSTKAAMREALGLILSDRTLITDALVDEAWTAQLKKNDGYTIARLLDSIRRNEDLLDGRMQAVTAPTLVVWGRDDRVTGLAGGDRFANDIRGAHLKVIDRCGHEPQLECPAALNAALLAFLTER